MSHERLWTVPSNTTHIILGERPYKRNLCPTPHSSPSVVEIRTRKHPKGTSPSSADRQSRVCSINASSFGRLPFDCHPELAPRPPSPMKGGGHPST